MPVTARRVPHLSCPDAERARVELRGAVAEGRDALISALATPRIVGLMARLLRLGYRATLFPGVRLRVERRLP